MTLANNVHDRAMTAVVRPSDWPLAPLPPRYDLVAIGGGTGGLVAASGAGLLGATTALIERDKLGGDCLIHGCVPSKALLHTARIAHAARNGPAVGVHTGDVRVDFPAVMDRLRKIRADIAHDDAATVLAGRGIDVRFGTARFTGPRTLDLDGQSIAFKRAVIATGGRPRMPAVPGLADVALTNASVFDLDELPRRLLVLGGGPIGCELAQAFARFGSQVLVAQRADRLLPGDDPEASDVLLSALRDEGIDVRLKTTATAVSPGPDGGHQVDLAGPDGPSSVVVDQILVAVGREPNVEGLGLKAAGVTYSSRGIHVGVGQRTTNRRIYAVGDVAEGPNFTHAAYAQGARSTLSALFPFRSREPSPMSWVTFTDPEVAHVGLRHDGLLALGDRVETVRLGWDRNDRARTDGDARGFAKIHLRRGTERLLGATFVGRDVGELVGEVALAMTARKGLAAIRDTIHPYPTRSWLTRDLAIEHGLGRVTPWVKRLLRVWFDWGLM
ncbi:MAG: FAD-dependent oxidoreductase [Myxococcota bacterium]